MGHERVGLLPRSRRWREVVRLIGQSIGPGDQLPELAATTIENVRGRFHRIHLDPGVKAALGYLLALATPAAIRQTADSPQPNLEENPSPLRLAIELRAWVGQHDGSPEYSVLATRAAADAIAAWTRQQKEQPALFRGSDDATEVWRSAQNARGFCEVSRTFLAKFTERYLNYFLEREASAVLPTIQERDLFATELRDHIDLVSRHAFETSKIAQSFAAGWYNNHARHAFPSDREIERFLATAFGKVREELLREGNK